MWLLLDLILFLQTCLHAVATLAIATPVDSPLKKIVTKVMHRVNKAADANLLHVGALGLNLAACVTTAKAGAWDDITMRTRFCVSCLNFLSAHVYMKLGHAVVQLGPERILELEQELMNKDILSFEPPNMTIMDAAIEPLNQILQTEVVGLDRIPADAAHFYVMNHSLGGIEMPSFVHTLYKKSGVFVRGLADHFHWAGPHGPLLRAFGAVDGTRPNVDMLMENGQNLLVYPGGGAEILKSASVERYTLMWKERLGFARMAIKNKYPILPCACVGTEDMLDIMADLPLSFLGKSAPIPSVPLLKPNSLQKVYFWFGEPIPTAQYQGDWENTEFAKEVRDKTKAAIEAGIKELQEKQVADPDRFLIDRVGKQVREAKQNAWSTFRSLCEGIKTD
eukprot:TRINITY_DN26113_c0_g3_i1.p1 TRINITY_DN26113_c0_g3~~TRINITY_DN26113_c0_g3_i1.p1  ORF type:complete len:393 (-),score=68.57 TRINITY_DN26113_c0_g3_i1:260-1438(-)